MRWGITGVAIFRTASFLVLLLPGLKFAGRPINLKISMIMSEVWRYAFSAAAAGAFCSLALLPRLDPLNIWLRVGAVLTAFLVSYAAAIMIVYRSTGPIKRVFALLKLLRPNN